MTDPSNLETEQDRNYLRQTILPAVAERWPGYRETIQRAAALQAMAQQRLSQLPLPRTETAMGELALVIDPTVDVAELAAQIHQWLGEFDIDRPTDAGYSSWRGRLSTRHRIVCPSCVGARVACASGAVG